MVRITTPGSKLKTSKSFLQDKIGHIQTLFFWYCFQTFYCLSSAKILDPAIAVPGFSDMKTWMASVTYDPAHFVVLLFLKTKCLHLHITGRTQNLRPFRTVHKNFEGQTGFWRTTKRNYSS